MTGYKLSILMYKYAVFLYKNDVEEKKLRKTF